MLLSRGRTSIRPSSLGPSESVNVKSRMGTGDYGHRHKHHLLFLLGTNLELMITENHGHLIAAGDVAANADLASEERHQVDPMASQLLPVRLRRARTVSGPSVTQWERSWP